MIIIRISKTILMISMFIKFNGIYLLAQSSLFYSVPYFETHTINPIHGSYYLEGVQANELMYSRLWTWKKDISETSDLVEIIDSDIEKSFKKMLVPPIGENTLWSYKIKIREDLKWPDGKPLRAEDVKFSFEVYSADKTKSALKEFLTIFKKIKVLDDRTIQFFVKQKDLLRAQYILPLVQVLPKHKVLTNYLLKSSKFTNEPMGSGPFQFVPQEKRKSTDKGQSKIVFDRNQYYYRWNKNSNISSINITVENKKSTVVKKLNVPNRAEDWSTLDLVLNTPNSVENFRALTSSGSHLSFKPYSSNSWYGIALNCEKPFFQNRKIRMALTHAVDIEQLINDYYTKVDEGGRKKLIADRISGPYNPIWGISDTLQPIVYDKVKADSLLDNNGVKEKINIRIFNGKPIELKLIYNKGRVFQGSPEDLIIIGLIKDLKAIGIKVEKVELGAKAFSERLISGEYDLAFQYYEIGYGNNIAPLFKEGDKQNISRFSDPMLSSYLEKFNISKGKQKLEYGKKIHQIVYKEAPYIFLYRLDKIMAYRDEELETNNQIVPKYFFTHIGEWYFKN